MKTELTIIEVDSDRILFRIGEDPKGYSCCLVAGIPNGSVSCGSSSNSEKDERVLIFECDELPWRVIITDQEIIEEVKKKNKSYWITQLIERTLKVASESNMLFFLLKKTVELEKRLAYKKGKLDQAKSIVGSLGLNPKNVSFVNDDNCESIYIPEEELSSSRDVAAEKFFSEEELIGLKDSDSGWTRDGNVWSRKLFWEETESPSRVGSFGVRFLEGSDEIIDYWYQ